MKNRFLNGAIAIALLLYAAAACAQKTPSASALIGKWQGGRHVTQYLADGTYILDPDITPQPIRESIATWRVEGNRLITKNVAGTQTYTIVSLTAQELVIKDEKGRSYHEKRVPR